MGIRASSMSFFTVLMQRIFPLYAQHLAKVSQQQQVTVYFNFEVRGRGVLRSLWVQSTHV
jgi:hypothetical protein